MKPEERPTPKWERVDGTYCTDRLRVPGGWLYRDYKGMGHETTMCFVPFVDDEGDA